MLKNTTKLLLLALLAIGVASCKKDKAVEEQNNLDKLLLVTNITNSNPVVAYIGTLRDLSVPNYSNVKSRQATQTPFIKIYGDDVFVIPNKGGDILKKYHRQPDGTLADAGSLTFPAASQSISIVVENETTAYCSLQNTGKIAVFDPSTLKIRSYIDLTAYALGSGSPGPSVMALKNGKLYVACVQTADGYTSNKPAQILIIDLANNNAITSATDSRTTWAGSIDEPHSLFFDEKGDLYVFCVASYGFGGPNQKCGFLRIKNGTQSFDPTYFFNIADFAISGIPNNKVDYLQHMRYFKQGVLYATGNIYALASNPPNYAKDRTMGSFKVDLYNKTISKLDFPYATGYSSSVGIFENKILFGLSTNTGIGIYTYDPVTGIASTAPVVNTAGDPSVIETF